MPKRKPVPTALHSELTEYSSLIRALRTSNTLDVTSHIAKTGTRPPPRPLISDDDDSEAEVDLELNAGHSEDDDTYSEPLNIPSTSHSRDTSSNRSSPSGSRKRKHSSPSPGPRQRDGWTRWPLLADDVPIPEWSLEDELGLLAATALKNQNRPPLPSSHTDTSSTSDDSSDDADGDPSTYLPHLTNAASNYLSAILALLVAHTPNRPQSQQNRIEPIGWRAVLDMLSVCGDPRIANPTIINNVKIRMETLYGQSETQLSGDILAHRTQSSIAAKARLSSIMSGPVESLLTLASPPEAITSPPRRLRRRRTGAA